MPRSLEITKGELILNTSSQQAIYPAIYVKISLSHMTKPKQALAQLHQFGSRMSEQGFQFPTFESRVDD